MKKSVLLLLLVYSSAIMSAQVNDFFSDGNFTTNPKWDGDASCFMVNTLHELQLNAPAVAGSAYLTTASSIVYDATWSFSVRMDFNPSSANYCKIYLTAGDNNLNNAKTGYYLRIGSANDDICLYKVKGTRDSVMIRSREKLLDTSTVNLSLKVTRNASGKWELLVDTTGGQIFRSLGFGTDNALIPCKAFGIQCFYTQTRSAKFFFDNIKVSGSPYSDFQPPHVLNYKIKNDTICVVSFSEPVDIKPGTETDFFMDCNPVLRASCDSLTNKMVELHFSFPLSANVENRLYLLNIRDLWGNVMPDTVLTLKYGSPLSIENKTFSPDNDGINDYLRIINQMPEGECRLTINLYDVRGRLIRQLFNNRVSPGDGNFEWNGLNDAGCTSPTGIYIIYIRAVYDNGEIHDYKKVCVLTRRK